MGDPRDTEGGAQRPTVSVICRTIGRDTLRQALDSVGQQSWRPIELVLVDAADCHPLPDWQADGIELLRVAPGTALPRSAAANAGLDAATGDFILFLDDDDWILPDHIRQLVEYLSQQPRVGVVYSSTACAAADGTPVDEVFRTPFSHARLRHDNFIPIHSALFRRDLLTPDTRFDETLEIFEDWDFWLQLAEKTKFVHLDVATACYRRVGDSGTATQDAADRYRHGSPVADGRAKLFYKWLPRWSGHQYNEALGDLDAVDELQQLRKVLDETSIRAHRLQQQQDELESRYHRTLRQKNDLQQRLRKRDATVEAQQRHVQALEGELERVYHSVSWKVTAPYRWLRHRLPASLGRFRAPAVPPSLPSGTLSPAPAGTSADHDAIQCHLDCPSAAEHVFSEHLPLNGWCLAPDGIQKLSCRLDGTEVLAFSPDLHRPDLESAFPGAQDRQPAGFQRRIDLADLAAGDHELTLTATDRSGRIKSVTVPFTRAAGADIYNDWYWRTVPEPVALERARADRQTTGAPIHVILHLPADADKQSVAGTLDSVSAQLSPPHVLHLVSPGTAPVHAMPRDDEALRRMEDDGRLHRHQHLPDALRAAREGWILIMEPGEQLAPQALLEFERVTATSGASGLIYSDHDHVDGENRHSQPCFAPDWAPDHVLSANPVGDVFLFRLPDEAAAGRDDPEPLPAHCRPAWRYHLLLRLSRRVDGIHHIARVLWSSPEPDPATAETRITAESGVVEHWLSGETGSTVPVQTDAHGIRRVLWPLERQPRVSIIIPTTGKPELVRPCMDSILQYTDYPDFEIIVLDNGRGRHPDGIDWLRQHVDQVIECNEPFNWARLNNIGAGAASGELLLFLNDDIEVKDPQWLNELVRQAQRDDIGTVGARLLYPDGRLQHAGVTLVNYGGGGIHLLHKADPAAPVYRHLHETQREVSANTGACLMVSRQKYDAVQGFEERLPVVGNDVDFCLRLADAGWRSIWTPYCTLIHHESISRKTTVPREDEQTMWSRWRERFMAGDPHYNPNLCSEKCDYTLRVDRAYALSAPEGGDSASSTQPEQHGVNLIGFIRAAMGIGEGARSDARALEAAREPFTIYNYESGNPARMTDLNWRHRESKDTPFDITLLHINPDHAAEAVAELPDRCFSDRHVIGYWAWELPEMPGEWIDAFRLVDEVWVPSQFCQQSIGMQSPVPVVTIPHCIDVEYDSKIDRSHFDLPGNRFLFLSMFDVNSRQERKNPYGAIEAFCQAFPADDQSACLVIKLNNATPAALKELHERIDGRHNIHILDGIYSRGEINALIANVDCFVSLHRSEGFGLGPAEAMSLGKVAMITRWSGNTDYMTADNCIGIDYRLVTLTDDAGPYRAGQYWAEPDLGQAAEAMQNLAADSELVARLGENARATIREHFSPDAVGRLMRKRLDAIRARRGQ